MTTPAARGEARRRRCSCRRRCRRPGRSWAPVRCCRGRAVLVSAPAFAWRGFNAFTSSSLTSSQFGPAATSTFSGTSQLHRRRSSPRATSSATAGTSFGGASKTSSSWTVNSIFACSFSALQPAVDVEHRQLDQVGGGALDLHVDRLALGLVAAAGSSSCGRMAVGSNCRRRPRIVADVARPAGTSSAGRPGTPSTFG